MGSQQNMKPQTGLISVPANYPTVPTPGKIQLLLENNTRSIYHRYTPYYSSDGSILSFGPAEPFIFAYPDEGKSGLFALRKYDILGLPVGSAPLDIIRVSKFLINGRGLFFLAKQFLLQTGNAYNETRIYNPTSPIVAAGVGLGLGLIGRPQRNFDTSAGLAGIATTLIGPTIPSLFGVSAAINPPAGTVGRGALPDINKTTDGKGLLRAQDANRAKGYLQKKWPQTGRGSSASPFGDLVKGLFTSVFANFIPQTQDAQYRGDESAYGLMVGAGSFRFAAPDARVGFIQRWVAGSTGIRKDGQYPSSAGRLFQGPGTAIKFEKGTNFSSFIDSIDDVVGYDIQESGDSTKPGFRYGDTFGKDEDYFRSDIMVQWGFYQDNTLAYRTKVTEISEVEKINATLKKTLDNIKKASGGIYTIAVPDDSVIISSGKATKNGYDRLVSMAPAQAGARGTAPVNYNLSVVKDYRTAQSAVVSNELTDDVSIHSSKLPTAGQFDAINTLTVLDNDRTVKTLDKDGNRVNVSRLKGWSEYKPYFDDQVAFFFYDIVNSKYIPFRATIKGLTESSNASWEELPFIGRGDKIYSYGGFNRNLTFNFDIVIGSISELVPTWQRISYLTTLVKPANYTNDSQNNIVNRFMVPPMVTLTIGDLYLQQPIVIQTITTTIPDDASWETLNQFNSKDTGWRYLADYMQAPNILYGQLPRTVTMGISALLLEKERAVTGGANFGDAPRGENWTDNIELPMHKGLVVDVIKRAKT